MAKGVSIKFKSYSETVPKLLEIIKFKSELQKYDKIVLKPHLNVDEAKSTSANFVEEVLKFCIANKNPGSEIFIAEGADGEDTMELFGARGFSKLSEKYSIGLVDLNNTEVSEILDGEFLKFEKVIYPKILNESFIISLPKVSEDEEYEMQGALSNMTGAFPARFYTGFFSSKKSKIRKWPIKYSIHDVLRCKMPEFSIIDASDKGSILAGVPLEMDKQAAHLLGKDWKSISYLKLVSESFENSARKKAEAERLKESKSAEKNKQ